MIESSDEVELVVAKVEAISEATHLSEVSLNVLKSLYSRITTIRGVFLKAKSLWDNNGS